MRQQGEPSVEEILESIKRVMERDERDLGEFAPRAAGYGVAPEAKAIPLEPTNDEEVEDILDLGEAGAPLEDVAEDESLTTDEAAEAMRKSLAALAMLSEPPAKPKIVRSGETSLEGMVRELLRPMMAQWLDAHLPGIVERMVHAEIARIAGKKR